MAKDLQLPVLTLKKGRDYPVRRGHPWIFSGALAQQATNISDGDLVEVRSDQGEFLGVAHFAPSSLALKILSWRRRPIDDQFWLETISAARRRRETLGLFSDPATDSFRLINAEGDAMPGLIVDLYAATAVLQCHSLGMWRARAAISAALEKVLGVRLKAVYAKNATHSDRQKAAGFGTEGFLLGTSSDPAQSTIREQGIRFQVDWIDGQKTGFFLDQRENRALVRRYAAGRDVLNAFSYSGGFSLAALAGAAKSVESVDSSASALDLLARNLEINPGCAGSHRSIQADFLEYMHSIDERFDLIILDPPAFAKQRSAIDSALKGYHRINQRALEAVRPSGMLWTFSCSQAISRELFRETVCCAAADSGRKVQILYEMRQAPCHPVSAFHPEGEYLKGLALYVD